MTEHIPLNKLVLSPRNVRKTNGEEDIEGLADSIHSKGLLQNLVVSEGKKGGKTAGKYEVDAGGRRWRALKLNAKQGRIPANWPVPCVIVPRDDAQEASLAENLQKIAMNPADEVEAFATIVAGYEEDGKIADEAARIANCARRFGRTERYVRQRLRLADLAPEILDALRDGEITIAAAEAYASHPDHKMQLQTFKKQAEHWNEDLRHHPRQIRDALEGKAYALDNWLVKYVGLDAYKAEGGRIEADLFFGEGEREMLLDTAIVNKLARAKASAEAQKMAQKDGWLDAELLPLGSAAYGYPATPKGYVRSEWGAKASKLGKKKRADALAAFRLTEEGKVEQLDGMYFLPEKAAAKTKAEDRVDYEAQWAAERRAKEITLRAARMAMPKFAGTPFEGRAFWPSRPFVRTTDEGNTVIEVEFVIPKAEVEANLEEAERAYDEELAAEKAEEEAQAKADEEPAEEDAAAEGQAETEEVPA